jgi:hypothetical protein
VEREGFEISHGSRRRITLRLVCTGGGPRRLLEYLFVVKSPLGAIEATLPSFSWKGVCSLVYGLGLERKRFTSQGTCVLASSLHFSTCEWRGEETSSSRGCEQCVWTLWPRRVSDFIIV